jgi:hypothetical protein
MPKGPNGEYRPRDSFQSGVVTLKIALGLMTEEDAKKLATKGKRKRKKSPRKPITKTARKRK